ncbi:DUF1493 family protein [Agarivorans sp. MS3-6]
MDIEEIYTFLVEEEAIKRSSLHPDSDLVKDLGIEGDDLSETIELFAEKFGVEMSEYRWYFHHREEGWNFGALFFKPPYAQVDRINVTPNILLAAASTKIWPISYPAHQMGEGRPDLMCNNIIIGGLGLIGLLLWVSEKFGT